MTSPETKPCDRCNVDKPLEEFQSRGHEVKTCRECLEIVRNRKRMKYGYTHVDGVWMKTCRECGELKPHEDFTNPNNPRAFYPRCLACREEIQAKAPDPPSKKAWAWEIIESPEGIPPYDPQFLGCETAFALREGV